MKKFIHLKRNFSSIFFYLFIVLGSLYVSPLTAGDAPPILELSSTNWDFGTVQKGIVVSNAITIKNNSPEETLLFMRSTCPCVHFIPEKVEIASGEVKEILITFDTEDYIGLTEQNIKFYSYAISRPLDLHLYGNIEKKKFFPFASKNLLKMRGLFYLFVYNIMFLVPLIIVFAVYFKGVTSEKIGLFYKKHIFVVKILMGLVFTMFTIILVKDDIPLIVDKVQTTVLKIEKTTPITKTETSDGYSQPLAVYIFGTHGCKICYRLKESELPKLAKEAGIHIEPKYFPLDKSENLLYFESLERTYGFATGETKTPALLVGTNLIGYEKTILLKVKPLFEGYRDGSYLPPSPPDAKLLDPETGKENLTKHLKLIPIAFAGFIDGINPCAFVTIIFLLSYLSMVKRSKKEIFYTGLFFSLGIFITYFTVGIGFMRIIHYFESLFTFLSYLIKFLGATMALTFAIYSFKDAFLASHGKETEMSLQLPEFLKKKIHHVIRTQVKSSTIFFSSFLIGFFVSLFELACTGQVYLPTILMILNL